MTRHPLNCGTCKYPHTSSCEYWKRVSDGLYEIKTETIWLEASVATVGCASHSNIINQQDDPCIECIHIKKEIQDAREKMLDELTKLRETGEYHLGMFHKLEEYERLWREEWDWIKSLRTTKGDVKTP